MVFSKKYWHDKDIQTIIGKMLRWGVLSSAIVTSLGGLMYLFTADKELPPYHTFHNVPEQYKTLHGIFAGLLRLDSLSIIQFGILLLLATPIARVLFSIFAFLLEKDYLYVVISSIVAGIIFFSMIGGLA
jgi:uncharacterized membrane protein